MRLNKFDILLVNFPFSDLSQSKKRPALVIKPLEGKNNIVCQITTKIRKISKYEIPLNRKQCEGDIRFESYIYADMIFALHESLTFAKIGRVKNNKVIDEVNSKIRNLFCS